MSSRRQRKSKRMGRDPDGDVIDVPFSYLSNTASAAGVKNITFASGTVSDGTDVSSRLDALSSTYVFWRLKRLEIHCLPAPAAGGIYSLVYVPTGSQVTVPTTQEDALELYHSWTMVTTQSVPHVIRLNRRDLKGQYDWYRTTASGDSSEYTNGIIVIRSGSSDTVNVVLKGVISYKQATDPSVASSSLRARIKQQLIEELEDDSKVVASAPTSSILPKSLHDRIMKL